MLCQHCNYHDRCNQDHQGSLEHCSLHRTTIVMFPWLDLDVLVVRQGGWENLVAKSVMETRCLWTVEIVFVAANVPLEIRVKLFVVALEHVTMKPVFSYHHYTLHVLHRGNHNLSQHNMVHIHR
jgi:hypothetical protein